MTEKQINKWLRRQFSPLCWALIGSYALLNLMVTAAMVTDTVKQTMWSLAAGDFFGELDMNALLRNGWGYVVAVTVTIVILLAWKGGGFFREAFQKKQPIRPGVFAAMLVLCMGTQMVNTLWVSLLELLMNLGGSSLMPVLEQVSGSTDSFSMFLYMGILAPVCEELLFRGLVFRGLRPYGKRFAIFGSALMFGLFHGNLLQTPYAFLMGLILGYLTEEYSLLWAIGLHMFNNLVLAEGFGRLTQLLPAAVADWMHILLFGAGALASLVILLRKRQEIAAYCRSEWMDRRCVKCLLTCSGFVVLTLISLVSILSMFFY